ncbi:MAG: hypothetical protein ACYDCL_15535 [Myxococcales bacterium]
MLRTLLVRCSAALALLAAAAAPRAEAQILRISGGGRALTVSGEPLLAYHLVEHGRAIEASVQGPLVVNLTLRRHSRSRHGGTASAALDLDGGEMDRFVLDAQPPGRYLAGFGFRPGPEKKRQIKLGPGRHRIAVRAIAGSIVVAFSAVEPELEAAPLVARAPAPVAAPIVASTPSQPSPQPSPPAEGRAASRGEGTSLAEVEPTPSVERETPAPRLERPPRALVELRVGSATQTQAGSTGFGGGADVRWYVARRFSVGVGVEAYDVGLGGRLEGSPSSEAVGPLSLGVSVLAVPLILEATYDQPLGKVVTLTLGLGAGADYQRFNRSVTSGPTALPAAASGGVAPMGEALVNLSVRAPGGRVGVELRIESSLPQDVAGVGRDIVVGGLLAEVGYQFLL